MKVRIGFLHKKTLIRASFKGGYFIFDENCASMNKLVENKIYEFKLSGSVPAEHEWYEKLDTVFNIEKLESHRDKYYIQDKSTRVVKAGKEIGMMNNFEYWILKKTCDMEGKIYPSGDFRFKKIIKKESDGTICFDGAEYSKRIRIVPENDNCSFLIEGVSVGIDFHWDHKENLEYKGELEVMIDNSGNLTGVNVIDLEEYLSSVNSSEMRNDNNIEMLKAQTIAARSTVLATMGKHHFSEGFDLCSDDHCQCYQGITKMSELSKKVTDDTRSEVLIFDSAFVDARYSKICGGITERYSTCWEDMDFPYLASFYDNGGGSEITEKIIEDEAEKLILDNDFDCFCNTKKHSLPESLEFCKDLFRWETKIGCGEIKDNLRSKFGHDIGDIQDIKVLDRGYSGRIFRLEIIGSIKNVVISKELNIRRLLSKTHLPSSAFLLDKTGSDFTIKGAGWGHGAGLCQIGAQIMGEKGYTYKEILKHYYRGAVLKRVIENREE
jgi:SpoIID/LytB domain protein